MAYNTVPDVPVAVTVIDPFEGHLPGVAVSVMITAPDAYWMCSQSAAMNNPVYFSIPRIFLTFQSFDESNSWLAGVTEVMTKLQL